MCVCVCYPPTVTPSLGVNQGRNEQKLSDSSSAVEKLDSAQETESININTDKVINNLINMNIFKCVPSSPSSPQSASVFQWF